MTLYCAVATVPVGNRNDFSRSGKGEPDRRERNGALQNSDSLIALLKDFILLGLPEKQQKGKR